MILHRGPSGVWSSLVDHSRSKGLDILFNELFVGNHTCILGAVPRERGIIVNWWPH